MFFRNWFTSKPKEVIKQEVYDPKIADIYSILKIDFLDCDNFLYTGEFLPGNIETIVDTFSEKYVQHVRDIENDLRKLKSDSGECFSAEELYLLQKKQFLTYKQFVTFAKGITVVFNDPEEDKKYHPRYYKHCPDFPLFCREILYIKSVFAYDRFKNEYSPDIKGYLKLIKDNQINKLNDFFLKSYRFYIPESAREGHTYITGGSGSGKSELIKLLIHSDLDTFFSNKRKIKKNIILIDPGKDLALQVAQLNTQVNKNNLVYIEPDFVDGYSPCINPLETKDKSIGNIDRLSQEIFNVFNELLDTSSLSDQMKALLIPCISTLLLMDGATLMDLQRFMDNNLNADLVELGKNSIIPTHKNFFLHKFHEKKYETTKLSISTKLQIFINSTYFSNFVLGKSTIDLQDLMNNTSGKLIIFNIPKGKLGDDVSEIIGRLILAQITAIGFKRDIIPENKRVITDLYVDEFHNFIGQSIQKGLDEIRKYKIRYTLACQYVGQKMDKDELSSVLSNTSVKIIGRNNFETLSKLSKETDEGMDTLKKLNRGEFIVSIRDNEHNIKIKIPPTLLKSKGAMTPEEWKEIANIQLQRYYRFTQNSTYQSMERKTDTPPLANKEPNFQESTEFKPKYKEF